MSKNYESLLNNVVVILVVIMILVGSFDPPPFIWNIIGGAFLGSGILHGILVFSTYPGKRLKLMIFLAISSIVIAILNFRIADHLLRALAK